MRPRHANSVVAPAMSEVFSESVRSAPDVSWSKTKFMVWLFGGIIGN